MDICICKLCGEDYDKDLLRRKGRKCKKCLAKERIEYYHTKQKNDPDEIEKARKRSKLRYDELNPDDKKKYIENVQDRYWENRNEILNQKKDRQYTKKWREKNPDKHKAYAQGYRTQHNLATKKWSAKNKDKKNYSLAKRRALKLLAMPNWLNDDEINQMKIIYKNCNRMNKLSDIKNHVDHIFPLQGEDSCGLHVPWNLQIITASDNLAKGNKIDFSLL